MASLETAMKHALNYNFITTYLHNYLERHNPFSLGENEIWKIDSSYSEDIVNPELNILDCC